MGLRETLHRLRTTSGPRSDHLVLGHRGELEAARFLRKKGYKILFRHYTCPIGELDIVAQHQGALVFIEVKTRSRPEDHPEDAVNHRKRRKLTRLAEYFVARHRLDHLRCQFDVVAVTIGSDDKPQITHFPEAF